MRAMALAAGMGTRLLPLTADRPKALVEIGGRPLLALLLDKLFAFGASRVVVNTHHKAREIERFAAGAAYPDGWIRLSPETTLLGTGGGVRNAAPFLGDEESVLVHNVDVLSNIPFRTLLESHERSGAAVTLVVGNRRSSRSLAFDPRGLLCGRWGEDPVRDPEGEATRYAFNGIQVLAPGIAGVLPGEGAFSLVDSYLALAARGAPVRAFLMDDWYWAEVGSLDRLEKLRRDLDRRWIPLESLSG
jgi:NDP-sugar pyrophosphorylase family protein